MDKPWLLQHLGENWLENSELRFFRIISFFDTLETKEYFFK